MSASFFAYGIFNHDIFIYVSFLETTIIVTFLKLYIILSYPRIVTYLFEFQVPNGIGTLLGVVQLGLYCYYKSTPEEDSSEPLMISYR